MKITTIEECWEKAHLLEPTFETLAMVHALFVHNALFSSLDIMMGIKPTFDPAAAYEKVVVQGQGGTCRMINLAAKYLLQKIGFEEVDCFSSEVVHVHKTRVPEGSAKHMTMIVRLTNTGAKKQSFIFDPGFGNAHRLPLPLTGEVVNDIMASYRVVYDLVKKKQVVQESWNGEWFTQFEFDDTSLMDQIEFDRHTDFTYDDKHFYRNNIYIQRCSEEGALQLFNDTLQMITPTGSSEKRSIIASGGLRKVLMREFGLPKSFVDSINFDSPDITDAIHETLVKSWNGSPAGKLFSASYDSFFMLELRNGVEGSPPLDLHLF